MKSLEIVCSALEGVLALVPPLDGTPLIWKEHPIKFYLFECVTAPSRVKRGFFKFLFHYIIITNH